MQSLANTAAVVIIIALGLMYIVLFRGKGGVVVGVIERT